MAPDILVLYVARTSAAMILTMQDKWVLVFCKEGFQTPVPSQFEMIKNKVNMFVCFLNKFGTARVKMRTPMPGKMVFILNGCPGGGLRLQYGGTRQWELSIRWHSRPSTEHWLSRRRPRRPLTLAEGGGEQNGKNQAHKRQMEQTKSIKKITFIGGKWWPNLDRHHKATKSILCWQLTIGGTQLLNQLN